MYFTQDTERTKKQFADQDTQYPFEQKSTETVQKPSRQALNNLEGVFFCQHSSNYFDELFSINMMLFDVHTDYETFN